MSHASRLNRIASASTSGGNGQVDANQHAPDSNGSTGARNELICLRVPALPTHVRQAHQSIMARLRTDAMSRAVLNRIELALAETMNNIVEHAYRQKDLAHFTVRVEKQRNAFHFQFKDVGLPMPSLQTPSGTPQDLSVALSDLPEGGFGWVMIRALTDQLEYRRDAGTNILAFRVSAGARSPDDTP